MIDIKDEPELRHVLAHIFYAIEALKAGCPLATQFELDGVKELVFWGDDSYEAIEADLQRREKLREEEDGQEELSGQKELQRERKELQRERKELPRQKEVAAAADLAWAAGLFDGDGCVTTHPTSGLQVLMSKTDQEVLDRFCKVAALGKVYGPYSNGPGKRQRWQYQIADREDIRTLYRLLWNHLGSVKKDQYTKLI